MYKYLEAKNYRNLFEKYLFETHHILCRGKKLATYSSDIYIIQLCTLILPLIVIVFSRYIHFLFMIVFKFVAVRESLKADGNLDRIKAEMRTEVIKLLDCSAQEKRSKTIKPSHDIVFLNELVREYLDWMGYKYSSTVFIAGTLFYRIYT